jgi:hypothetical protein
MSLFKSTQEKIHELIWDSPDEAIKLIETKNFDPNLLIKNIKGSDEKITLLSWAIAKANHYGNIDVIQALIKKGANPNLSDSNGSSPLYRCKNLNILYYLLTSDVDPFKASIPSFYNKPNIFSLLKDEAIGNLEAAADEDDEEQIIDYLKDAKDKIMKYYLLQHFKEFYASREKLRNLANIQLGIVKEKVTQLQKTLSDITITSSFVNDVVNLKKVVIEQEKSFHKSKTDFFVAHSDRDIKKRNKDYISLEDIVTKKLGELDDHIHEINMEFIEWFYCDIYKEFDKSIEHFNDILKKEWYPLYEKDNKLPFLLGEFYYFENSFNLAIEQFKKVKEPLVLEDRRINSFQVKELIISSYIKLDDLENAKIILNEYLSSLEKVDEKDKLTDDFSEDKFKKFTEVFKLTTEWELGLRWLSIFFQNEFISKESYFILFNSELKKWNDIGEYYEEKNDINKAIEYYTKANNNDKLIELSQNNKDFAALGKLLENKKDFVGAAQNYFEGKLYEDSKRLYLKLGDSEKYFEVLSKIPKDKIRKLISEKPEIIPIPLTDKKESKFQLQAETRKILDSNKEFQFKLNEFNTFNLDDVIKYGLMYSLTELISEYIILEKYDELNETHINIIQPLYTAILNIENRNNNVDNSLLLLSLKFGVEDEAFKIIDSLFNRLYSELLKGSLNDNIAKSSIEKLLSLNGYRILHDISNQDYLKIQTKLFDEFRLLNLDNYNDYESILKYKIADISFSQNWSAFNEYLSLITTNYTVISKFGSLFKILIENLLDESKDKADSLNQYWRYAKRELKNVSINSLENIEDSIYTLHELQPEFLIYQYWNKTFFSEKQSSEQFNSIYSNLIEIINNTLSDPNESNLNILLNNFLNFYNNNNNAFKDNVSENDQINLLSTVCGIYETHDVTLHNNIIDILEKEYNYEYGV